MQANETLLPFQRIQEEIGDYLRDPTHHPIPEHVDPKGIAHYTELLFNNLNEILSNSFPVLYSVLDHNLWIALVKDFFKQHHSSSPFFYEIPKEFLDYLNTERNDENDPVFLNELAHYEWVELALEISDKEIPHKKY